MVFRLFSIWKSRELELGEFAGTAPVSLALARRKADESRTALAEGRDPYSERALRKSDERIFEKIAQRFMTDRDDWQPHTRKEWERHLLKHSISLSTISIGDVDTDAIEDVFRPIWEKRPATGQRVRARIEAVLDYAAVKKLRSGDNPARWGGPLPAIGSPAMRLRTR